MPLAYSVKDILEDRNVFYEVALNNMTMDGCDDEVVKNFADWLGISVHALKCRWKRIFGYSLNELINYNEV